MCVYVYVCVCVCVDNSLTHRTFWGFAINVTWIWTKRDNLCTTALHVQVHVSMKCLSKSISVTTSYLVSASLLTV